MAISFDDLIIDRVLQGVFETEEGIVGGVNQLINTSIETTSESKDKTDAQGVLIKRFFTSKSVEISAENAVFSTSLAAIQFGNDRQVANDGNAIVMPRILKVNTNTAVSGKITLPDTPEVGSITVCGVTGTGVPDATKTYKSGTTASTTEFVLSGKSLTLPTGVTGMLQIKYDRPVTNGVKITQTSGKFPKTCKLTLSVLVCEACDKEVLRHAYIYFPSFQMSPDNTISLNTEDTQSFSGTAQMDYCAVDGEMFSIYLSDDDTEE